VVLAELATVEEKLQISSSKQQKLIIEILEGRFGQIPSAMIDRLHSIQNLEQLNQLLQTAIATNSINDFLL
jgi:hypothetical protein